MRKFEDGTGAPTHIHSPDDACKPFVMTSFEYRHPAFLDHPAAEQEHIGSLGRQTDVRLRADLGLGDLAAKMMDHRGELHSETEAERLRQLAGKHEAVLNPSGCTVRIAEVPEYVSRENVARDAGVVPGVLVGQTAMLVDLIQRDPLLEVLKSPSEVAAPVERVAENIMSDEPQH